MMPENFWTRSDANYLRNRLSAEQNHRCAYCGFTMLPQTGRKHGKRATFQREATIDEVIPRSAGGSRSWGNTVAACRWCNQYRGNVSAEEAFYRIRRLVARGTHPHAVFLRTGRFPRPFGLRSITVQPVNRGAPE